MGASTQSLDAYIWGFTDIGNLVLRGLQAPYQFSITQHRISSPTTLGPGATGAPNHDCYRQYHGSVLYHQAGLTRPHSLSETNSGPILWLHSKDIVLRAMHILAASVDVHVPTIAQGWILDSGLKWWSPHPLKVSVCDFFPLVFFGMASRATCSSPLKKWGGVLGPSILLSRKFLPFQSLFCIVPFGQRKADCPPYVSNSLFYPKCHMSYLYY